MEMATVASPSLPAREVHLLENSPEPGFECNGRDLGSDHNGELSEPHVMLRDRPLQGRKGRVILANSQSGHRKCERGPGLGAHALGRGRGDCMGAVFLSRHTVSIRELSPVRREARR